MVLVVSAPQIRFLERSLLWEKSRIFIPREKRRCCPTLASRTSGSLTRSSPLPSEVKIGGGGQLVQCCERSSGGCFRRRRCDETGEDKRTMTDDFKRRPERQHVTVAVSTGKCLKSAAPVLDVFAAALTSLTAAAARSPVLRSRAAGGDSWSESHLSKFRGAGG